MAKAMRILILIHVIAVPTCFHVSVRSEVTLHNPVCGFPLCVIQRK